MLNGWRRRIEKPRIARAKDPKPLRRALETQARMFFHAPRGTQQSWTMLGKVDALEVVPANLDDTGRVLFYIHGGGFTFGSPRTHAALAAQLAHRLRIRAVLPRYRLAPEAPYPAAPDDIRAAWDGLMAQGIAAGDVVLGGDSAGGALAFGLLCDLGARKEPMPSAVFGFSPLADLTYSGESFQTNAAADAVLPAGSAAALAELFLRGQPCDDPRVSPLCGAFKNPPPVWITVGDTEILLDDARRLAALCQQGGAPATLVERRDLPHVWPIFHNILPEARETLDQLATWIRQQPAWRGGN
jgi:acetyl esterase/lipase